MKTEEYQELIKVVKGELSYLLKLRKQFPWVPGVLGVYMRNKVHEDARSHIKIIRQINCRAFSE